MSAPLIEQQIVPPAERFIEERLADGNTLAKTVLNELPLAAGKIFTFLPKGVTPQSISDFATGGKLPTPPTSEWSSMEAQGETLLMVPVPNTDAWLAAKIKEHLRASPDHVCVIEDALKRPEDPFLRKLSTNYAIHDGEIYHLLFSQDAQSDRVDKVIMAARSVPIFIGVLATCRDEPLLKGAHDISSSQLKALAASTEKLFVGAFDGEGYLLWIR